MPSSYRVVTDAHQNDGSAYRRFERQPLVAGRGVLLQRLGRRFVALAILVLATVLALQL
jgi:hypothetical protein